MLERYLPGRYLESGCIWISRRDPVGYDILSKSHGVACLENQGNSIGLCMSEGGT